MTTGRTAVVVMAYGTPRTPGDVEAYYTHIRRGRAPTPELLAELKGRYDALGGVSPLAQRTEAQRAGLQAALDQRAPGRFTAVLGQKHAAPFIEDAIDQVAADGFERVVGLVLAPHYSGFSVGQYQERLREAAAAKGVKAAGIESWHLEEAYLAFLTTAVEDGLAGLAERVDRDRVRRRADRRADQSSTVAGCGAAARFRREDGDLSARVLKVLFTAHSLPERVLAGDPYPDQLRQSASEVAARVGLNRWAGWAIAWQSAGRTPEPWRGPDVLAVIRQLAETGRADGVLVCAQGFVADHLEVLYDLDIEARRVADEVGLAFARTRSLNDDPDVLAALADRVVATADTLA
jgi:ferrochelatase